MYNLTDDQIASVEGFIAKIPDSLIKSRCEKWLAEVKPTKRATSEQMEQFIAFATHLPKELQNFPQAFESAVRNSPEKERREAKDGVDVSPTLTSLADDSISNVPNVNAPKNKEETLHKLGTKQGSKGGKSISEPASKGRPSKEAEKKPTEKVREGAKLNPEKEAPKKAVKPVIVIKGKGGKK